MYLDYISAFGKSRFYCVNMKWQWVRIIDRSMHESISRQIFAGNLNKGVS